MLFAYFCCQLPLVSNTAHHGLIPTLDPHCSIPQLSPLTLHHPLSSFCHRPHSDSPWHDRTPSYCPLALYVAHSQFGTFFAIPVNPRYTLLVSSCSLDVRGYASHNDTRCCCSLLQYFPVVYAIFWHCF